MNKNKRIISTIILVSIISSILLSSCSSNEPNNSDTTSPIVTSSTETTSSVNTEAELLRENTPDSLPSELDFKGETFDILCRSDSPWYEEIYSESENGDIVNDTIFKRNKSVEERLNVKINVISKPGIRGNEAAFNNALKGSILSGDDAYDLVAGYAFFITPLAAEGLFTNLLDVPNLDFTQPWWNKSMANELNINNKLYFMVGDLSLSMTSSMFCTFFNKSLVNEWDIQDPYKLVLDGKWTIDKLNELSNKVSKDLDGDSKYDNKDLYGYGILTGNHVDTFLAAFDQPVTAKSSTGLPELALNTTKMAQMVDKTYDLLNNSKGVYSMPENTDNEKTLIDMFVNNQLMFMPGMMRDAESLRNMNSDYGIIPYPKFDEAQEKYQTSAQDAYSLFCIPVSCKNMDMAGAVTEALAAESYRYLTPAYYEIALKSKYTRDDTSSQMLDIIRDDVIFNFGFVNSSSMGWISHIYRNLMTTKSKAFASEYAKTEKQAQNGLDKLISSYKEIE